MVVKQVGWPVAGCLLLAGCFGSNGAQDVPAGDGGADPRLDGGEAAAPAADGDADSGTPSGSRDGAPAGATDAAPAPFEDPLDAGRGPAPGTCTPGLPCTPPPGADCGSLTVEADVATAREAGNVLFVHDRSGSMAEAWGGSTRWEALGDAVQAALASVEPGVRVGSVFFPSVDPGAPAICIDPTGIACLLDPSFMMPSGTCNVSAIDSADQIDFVPATSFPTALAGTGSLPLHAPVPGGFTPVLEALQQADAALGTASLSGRTIVVLLTDGAPNCSWDEVQASSLVGDWLASGIETHVMAIPGASNTDALSNVATAGGNSLTVVAEPSVAEATLRAILQEVDQISFASCTFELTATPSPPEDLHLVVTEGGLQQEVFRSHGSAGWSLSGSAVELTGALCDDVRSGRFEEVRFELGCVDLPPLPEY